jgi:hypothetical protein
MFFWSKLRAIGVRQPFLATGGMFLHWGVL